MRIRATSHTIQCQLTAAALMVSESLTTASMHAHMDSLTQPALHAHGEASSSQLGSDEVISHTMPYQ